MRPPRVRTRSFPPSIRRIYTSGPCSCRASSCLADLPTFVCLMRFLFVGSVVCRRLPSAHVSRRRPCLWLCAWRYLLHSGLAPIRTRPCRAQSSRRCRYRPPPLTPPPVRIRRTTFRLLLRRFSMFYFHSNGRYESANHVQPFDFRKSLVSVVAKI